jgi:hypothetical protein
MFIHMSVHFPKPGCVDGRVLKSLDDGKLIGLAVWKTKAEWEAARPAMGEAVKDDPFEEWEEKDPEVFHLEDA